MSAPTVELMTEQRALVVGGAAGKIVWLTIAEYRVYEKLSANLGQFVTQANLHAALYGAADPPKSNSLQVIVSRLRKKLADAGAEHKILVVWKVGYRMTTDAAS